MTISHEEAIIVQLGLIAMALEITLGKRADYADESDPYLNYRDPDEITGIRPWQYAIRRNLEKFKRRANIARNGFVVESRDDAFLDSFRDSINMVHIELSLMLEEMPSHLRVSMMQELRTRADFIGFFLNDFRVHLHTLQSPDVQDP